MKSEIIGNDTSASEISAPEILNVSPHGFWLLVAGREYFLSFDDFPWFGSATLGQLFRVELHHEDHLYWPELDVDLDLERIAHPERFPLVARSGSLPA
jgi:hypothetical protein